MSRWADRAGPSPGPATGTRNVAAAARPARPTVIFDQSIASWHAARAVAAARRLP
jgi:hypothetical protein